ncbi:LysR family transcriptional regulator ArgP [Novosphingobium terrae]|uniref:LysR family transcriptional regulator ArgP n=1 Tax=Novosphingobium terrae TaxID=2726189 RepID=UPI0019804CBB|nr:LysR family transcriptional regulator ArgP [Novosphingobium terrae]
MLDYPSLCAVSAVVTEGSFEKAAAALAMTPSAVSQRVRGLEERLGSILILRGSPCMPTDLGSALCAHLDRVRLLEHDMGAVLGQQADNPAALTLRVAVNSDSLATWFPAAIATFARQTGIALDIRMDDEEHTADRLRSGDVLAAVTADTRPVQGCKTAHLGALRYVACASPAFIARHFAQGVTAETLAHAPYLRFDRRDLLQARWAREALGAEPTGPVHWVPSTTAFIDLTLEDLGWSLHPLSLVQDHLAAGRLVELPPQRPLDVTLHWVVPRLHSPSLQHLSAAIREVAGRLLM